MVAGGGTGASSEHVEHRGAQRAIGTSRHSCRSPTCPGSGQRRAREGCANAPESAPRAHPHTRPRPQRTRGSSLPSGYNYARPSGGSGSRRSVARHSSGTHQRSPAAPPPGQGAGAGGPARPGPPGRPRLPGRVGRGGGGVGEGGGGFCSFRFIPARCVHRGNVLRPCQKLRERKRRHIQRHAFTGRRRSHAVPT
jgi:hypothetical protein